MTRRVLIIVQNLPVPFDRRVWQEATTLAKNGYLVSVICPKGKGFDAPYECLDSVHIHRHPLPWEAEGALGYLLEYSSSLFWEFVLAWKVFFARGFDVIHACNPPDNIFLIGGFFKYLFGKKFLFDHHDINPELYEAKFGRRDFFYRVMLLWERWTFKLADVSIATNESYKKIAVTRGHMPPDKVFVVRSGPSLERMRILPPVPALKMGKQFLVGYVGVMGQQEGIQYLLEAARIMTQEMKRSDVHFTLVGGGPALEELKKLAAEKNVSDVVTFTGRAPDQELLEVLNTADVCVNPDEVNPMNDQSTMNKIMEYMALGKPIVQFDVTEGKFSAAAASLYAKPNDAQDLAEKVVALLDDPAKRAAMGAFGRARVENELAWSYEIPKLLAAYEALFASGGHGFYDKCLWYYRRIAAMSAPEIFHRTLEVAKRRQDKYFPKDLIPAAHDRGALPQIPGLREKLTQPLPEWEEQVRQARAGKFFLLGQHWPECAPEKKWHLDPVTGSFWPEQQYCFDINYRHASGKGDIKYVWELNRLQYLHAPAALAFVQRDAALAKFCLDEIESWIDHNPPHLGVNWASGIELALRAVSMLVVTTLVGEHATEAQRAKIWQALQLHALWLERYPSKYSSANNHLTAEGLGLFIIGALCPQLPGAGRWKERGWQMLCETAQLQILPDGVGAEQAIAYTMVVLEMLWLAQYVARADEVSVPEYYTKKIRQAEECLQWFTDTGGHYPRIGDDDEALVFPLRWALENPAPLPQPEGVRIFEQGGYTVGRHTIKGRNILLAMDHGPLGYLSIAAHGHADALAVWLHIDNQPVLVDAGTYLYHSGGEWRAHFRSTAAHNTLCLQHTDSSTMSGAFNWSHKANARLTAQDITPERWRIEAEHDGYLKDFGCLHCRVLSVEPERGFTIEDALTGNRAQAVEIGFLLHPALSAIVHDGEITVARENNVLLRIRHEGVLAGKIETGWYSPRFGEKISAPRIVFSGMLAPGQKVTTYFQFA